MDFKDKIVVVTGAGSGIGAALAFEAVQEGASKVVFADVSLENAQREAEKCGGIAMQVDMSDEVEVAELIETIEATIGPIDIFFSNAGILVTDAPTWDSYQQTTEQWHKVFAVNVYAHVHVARVLFPQFKSRGQGVFVLTASAAGLLAQIGDASYTSSKHAAVGLAESMAIAHGDDGIQVSVLCPQAVESRMSAGAEEGTAAMDGIMPADEMARRSFAGVKAGQFMIRPHEQVESYFQHKADNYDRWVGGMRKMRRIQLEKTGRPI